MPKVINTFSKGVMNKSTDKSYIPQDMFIEAENLRFSTTDNNDGIGKSLKGFLEVSNRVDANPDYKCICAVFNQKKDTIIYFLATSSGALSKIVEYDTNTGVSVDIIKDDTSKLKFNKNGIITGVNVIDDLLIFSEWGNNIRRINIERAKNYGLNNFTEEDITLIVKPPFNKPLLKLGNTTSESQKENNIEEKFIYFSYRWRYLDGEYSALAPFSLPAFEPKTFEYDFSVQSNKSMVNKYNQVEIAFNTGGPNVTEIQLVFKESQDTEVFIINDFVKTQKGWGNNEVKTFKFDNFNGIRGLSREELRKTFDNIPRSARCQTVIDGRLLFANYQENYNIVDSTDNKIKIDYTLELESKEILGLIPKKTVKSNRDLEVVIAYMDEYLRTTTLLKSENNTIYVPANLSIKQNEINVILKNKPPKFAKYFRFFVKQTKKDYETVIPTLFYQDGIYVWVKLEESDIDKVRKGDYLIIKSDSQGRKDFDEKVKVIDVKFQERNFLETEELTVLKQQSGTYFKVTPKNFRLDLDDLEVHESLIGRANNDPMTQGQWYNTNHINIIYDPIYYGDSDLNDLTKSGTFSGTEDIRYEIKIDSIGDGVTTFNTFSWNKNGGSSVATNQVITPGSPILLDNGVSVTFVNNTGHTLNDRWIVSAKSDDVWRDTGKTYGIFPSLPENFIKVAASISLTYDEHNAESQFVEETYFSSGNYNNLEEWFYEENIDNKLVSLGITSDRIIFRRGEVMPDKKVKMSLDGTGQTIMIIRSLGTNNNAFDANPKVNATIVIRQSDNLIILETAPKETPSDIFYEIGKTYKIENNYHLGDGVNDVNQTISTDLKVKLDWYNAFAYGNGVESYKIRDEFNGVSIDVGTRVSSVSKEEYKETVRTEDITWTEVYSNDGTFNGLSSSNLSQINFITLDRENGSIQKIYNKNGNLMVLQEDGIGRLPYNKNIIYDTEGGSVVGIATNILNKESYFSYGAGKHGISKEPESFVSDGFRDYFTDKQRGVLIRLSQDGVTPISQNFFQNEFSSLMISNKNNRLLAGFDPKHEEYILHLPSKNECLIFKETEKGFSSWFTFTPDFILNANNEVYSWKNGVMYRHNATNIPNNFYGTSYQSKIKFVVNHNFGYEKIFKAIGLYSTHSWLVNLQTSLSSRQIPKSSFRKINNFWFSEIMGDTSDNILNNSIFGIGTYAINNGVINTLMVPASLSVGDFVRSKTLGFPKIEVLNINGNQITLDTNSSYVSSFLLYEKNQNVDGGNIKGDFMEVELISDETVQVEIRAVKTEIEIINRD